MPIVRLGRERAVGLLDPLVGGDVDGGVLVVEGVTAADDERLSWCRRAPCVVIACTGAGEPPPASADVALVGEEVDDLLDPLLASIDAHPHACRVLVDVLRATTQLDVPAGLTLESLAYSALLAGEEFAAWLATRPERRSRTFGSAPVRVERVDGELRITLARPENRNAFSAAMRDALVEALLVAEVDHDIDRVVIAADGPVFSSGGDLDEFGTAPDVVRAHEVRTQRSVGAAIARLAPRVTAVVHGPCVGAGVELSAFAGNVVAAPGTTFRLPEVAMGLIPGAGGTVSVARRVGTQATARLAILGEAIDAEAALAIGLIDEIR